MAVLSTVSKFTQFVFQSSKSSLTHPTRLPAPKGGASRGCSPSPLGRSRAAPDQTLRQHLVGPLSSETDSSSNVTPTPTASGLKPLYSLNAVPLYLNVLKHITRIRLDTSSGSHFMCGPFLQPRLRAPLTNGSEVSAKEPLLALEGCSGVPQSRAGVFVCHLFFYQVVWERAWKEVAAILGYGMRFGVDAIPQASKADCSYQDSEPPGV